MILITVDADADVETQNYARSILAEINEIGIDFKVAVLCSDHKSATRVLAWVSGFGKDVEVVTRIERPLFAKVPQWMKGWLLSLAQLKAIRRYFLMHDFISHLSFGWRAHFVAFYLKTLYDVQSIWFLSEMFGRVRFGWFYRVIAGLTADVFFAGSLLVSHGLGRVQQAKRKVFTLEGVSEKNLFFNEGRQKKNSSESFVGFVARSLPWFGHQSVFRAIDMLMRKEKHGFKAMWLDTSSTFEEVPVTLALKKLINELGIGEHVEYVKGDEAMRLDEMKHLLEREIGAIIETDLISDMVPMRVFQAMSVGMIVIAPRHGAYPEVIDHEESGLLYQPGDSNDLAEKLAKLTQDRVLIAKLRESAKNAVKNRFLLREQLLKAFIISGLIASEPEKPSLDDKKAA